MENINDIITLTCTDGSEMEFYEISDINYQENRYLMLQPVKLLDGMDNDDALVFKVSKNKDNKDSYEIETNEQIIDAIFEIYNKLIDEQVKNS